MEKQNDGRYLKKGPWTAEEDEILLNYVNKYGPRDWSSLRSNGLLPRTGKSCRLRWVNKLRPNLKKSKFSAEEERVVIELQVQFGNKWAKIATYLPGRTDNDVKNFWSTRRKRMEKMLQGANASSKSQHNKGKRPLCNENSLVEDIKPRSFPAESSSQSYMNQPHFGHELGTSGYHQPIQMTPSAESSSNCYLFEFPDYHQPDIPFYEGCQELIPAADSHSYFDDFLDQKNSETNLKCCHDGSNSGQQTETLEPKVMDDQKTRSETVNVDTFDYLDDLPTDLLDLDFFDFLP